MLSDINLIKIDANAKYNLSIKSMAKKYFLRAKKNGLIKDFEDMTMVCYLIHDFIFCLGLKVSLIFFCFSLVFL